MRRLILGGLTAVAAAGPASAQQAIAPPAPPALVDPVPGAPASGYIAMPGVAVRQKAFNSQLAVAGKVSKLMSGSTPERDEVMATPVRRHRRRSPGGKIGIHVEGLDDMMVRIARCCTPVPGDEIMGFVTRGRGVSVHRADCANAVSLRGAQTERLIEVVLRQIHTHPARQEREGALRAHVREVVLVLLARLLVGQRFALAGQHLLTGLHRDIHKQSGHGCEQERAHIWRRFVRHGLEQFGGTRQQHESFDLRAVVGNSYAQRILRSRALYLSGERLAIAGAFHEDVADFR